MRSRTAEWFEAKVRLERLQEDGIAKVVTESYAIDALSFTEAETRITDEMTPAISGDFKVKELKRAAYKEVFFMDDAKEDTQWYKVKLAYITIDEKTAKEKRTIVYYLVEGTSLSNAQKNLQDIMCGTLMDYKLVTTTETQILDVFEHEINFTKAAGEAIPSGEAEGTVAQ